MSLPNLNHYSSSVVSSTSFFTALPFQQVSPELSYTLRLSGAPRFGEPGGRWPKSSNSWGDQCHKLDEKRYKKTLDAICSCKVKMMIMMGKKVCSQKAWESPLKQNMMVSIVQVTALYWGPPINSLDSAE